MYIQKNKLFFFLYLFIFIALISCVKEKEQVAEISEIQSFLPELSDAQKQNIPNIFDIMADILNEKNNIETTNLQNKREIPDKTKYTDEILNLNGTWQPHWSYEAGLKMSEEEKYESKKRFEYDFLSSWGIGRSLLHTTFDIDITADIPFFHAEGDGKFYVTDITQINSNIIKVHVLHGDIYEREYIFHFIDKNTMYIENKTIELLDSRYGMGNFWHRLSGPDESTTSP